MLVPSTFTGWYRNTMMTSASPMAISRSRVQTRISLRRECAVGDPEGEVLLAGETGSGVSGIAEVGGSFSSALSIFGCQVFIARGLRAALDLVSGGGALCYTIRCLTLLIGFLGGVECCPL